MDKFIAQHPWAFVILLLIAIVGLIVFATHPDGFGKKDEK